MAVPLSLPTKSESNLSISDTFSEADSQVYGNMAIICTSGEIDCDELRRDNDFLARVEGNFHCKSEDRFGEDEDEQDDDDDDDDVASLTGVHMLRLLAFTALVGLVLVV